MIENGRSGFNELCDPKRKRPVRRNHPHVFRYEKFRTEWEMEEGHLVLDETPIGVWAELEGPPAWIDAMLERLCIAPELQSTESYGKLFLRWKAKTGSAAENLTFTEIAALAEAASLVEVAGNS